MYLFQDAHEFLGQVLDQLKDEVDAVNNKIKESQGELQQAAITEAKEDDKEKEKDNCKEKDEKEFPLEFPNPTSKNFSFEVLHTISCTE